MVSSKSVDYPGVVSVLNACATLPITKEIDGRMAPAATAAKVPVASSSLSNQVEYVKNLVNGIERGNSSSLPSTCIVSNYSDSNKAAFAASLSAILRIIDSDWECNYYLILVYKNMALNCFYSKQHSFTLYLER